MAQVYIQAGTDISSIHTRAAEAESLASLARATSTARSLDARVQGGSVANDRIQVAASAKFQSEIQGFAAAGRAVSHAASLLQAADDGLSEISGLLDEIIALAETVGDFADLNIDNDEFSTLDGVKLSLQFDELKARIDEIVDDTSFSGSQLLAGDGSGGDYEITYRVGTGTDASSDEITIQIAAADVASLSSGLDSGDFSDQTNAETAYTDATEAKIALNSIRHGISGDLERFGVTEMNATDFSARAEDARSVLADPVVAIDFSQLGADRLSDQAKLHLVESAAQQVQRLVSRIDVSAPAGEGDGAEAAPGAGAGAGAGAAPGAADRAVAEAAFKRSAATSPAASAKPSAPARDSGGETDITV